MPSKGGPLEGTVRFHSKPQQGDLTGVQILYPTDGSVNRYLAALWAFIKTWDYVCPWCGTRHRLWSHGQYERWVYLPQGRRELLTVLRFFCRFRRATVSLLPDFCLPRKRVGTAVLGRFLEAHVIEGCSVPAAMKCTQMEDLSAVGAATAQVRLGRRLRAGFLARLAPIRVYVGSLRPRFEEYVSPARRRFSQAATVLQALRKGFGCLAEALQTHGPRLWDECHTTWA
jgi:hypothetical protein